MLKNIKSEQQVQVFTFLILKKLSLLKMCPNFIGSSLLYFKRHQHFFFDVDFHSKKYILKVAALSCFTGLALCAMWNIKAKVFFYWEICQYLFEICFQYHKIEIKILIRYLWQILGCIQIFECALLVNVKTILVAELILWQSDI